MNVLHHQAYYSRRHFFVSKLENERTPLSLSVCTSGLTSVGLYLSVCVCLSVLISVYVSVSVFIGVSLCLSVCLSVFISVYVWFNGVGLYLSGCVCVRPSVRPSVCLSVCLCNLVLRSTLRFISSSILAPIKSYYKHCRKA